MIKHNVKSTCMYFNLGILSLNMVLFCFRFLFDLLCFVFGVFLSGRKKNVKKSLEKVWAFQCLQMGGGVARPFSLLCMNVKKKIMHRCNRVAQTSLDSIIYNDQKPTHPHAIVIYSHFFRGGGIRFYPIFFSKCLKASQHHEHELSDPPPGVLGKHHE